MIKKFDEFIESLNESVSTDMEDVLAKKLGVDKLFRFVKQSDGSYESKPMEKVYSNSTVFNTMMEKDWKFIDFYKNDDLYSYRARKCYFAGEDPKETYKASKYKLDRVTKAYNEFLSQLDSLPKIVKDMVSENTMWVVLSPDNGICMICNGRYQYTMRIFFTGIRSYGRITSKTKDILRKRRLAPINRKRAATHAARKAEEEEYRKREEAREKIRQAEEDEKRRKKEEEDKKMKEAEEEFKKKYPEQAKILQYIFDTYYGDRSSRFTYNKIYQIQGKYNIEQIPVQIHNGKLYFDPMAIDIIDIQDIMKDISKKFDIDEYYEYDSDWYAKGDRYGKEPIKDFDRYEETWSEPDRFYMSHRSLKQKKSED